MKQFPSLQAAQATRVLLALLMFCVMILTAYCLIMIIDGLATTLNSCHKWIC